jgi:predicted acylesterase/phospholipase RssA
MTGPVAPADDPVFRLIAERAAAGSTPGARTDPHLLCLAVEGGGMRGAVSAGMAAVLEAAGLVGAFDRIYGCSAGALNGCFAAAGQAALWAASFEDTAGRAFIDPRRILRRQPVLDLGYLFETVIGRRKPLSAEGLARGPAFRALAVSLEDVGLRVLGDFRDTDDLLAAVRVSCAVPVLGGAPPSYRGEAMVDGSLIEPIPYRAALREGATHVLVLRSRDAAYRSRPRARVAEFALRRVHPMLEPLVRASGPRYNRDAEELAALAGHSACLPVVTQVAVPPDVQLVGRLSTDPGRVAASLRLGADAMAAALYGDPAKVIWRPVLDLPRAAERGTLGVAA